MYRLSACLIVGSLLVAGCAAPAESNGRAALPDQYSPDLTNQFLLGHLDDSQIGDPLLQQIVRAMRQDDFFRLTLERASCGDPAAQYWAGFDNQYSIALEGDPVTAHMWYALAAGQGHPTARRAMSRLSEGMTPGQITEARARAERWSPADC